ncbi:MAG: polyribonucleotide nucleotidyltransferase [Candidatus Marinimicrobia bacterium]|jgi:polyribonucleotide nucleotidyltransferase|nr:polyribonucleotide nucleotidyltransferase [Candidatus Neomarinimicrobiota bacterium]MBT3675824.1 polyribonucleotide nucleotidyltransferase [Candidatus Neomarinimicrobiota bacterium]MBT3762986.1 polyribonucleotide nucleotidyltransferase [Candidatus Neomarinimicrobiota bacterium]MBT4069133.1 polyribonucleotide nucleotidyltransferase [Candidatus Neomarinimicrobiota bacterium]MBT4271519.1 polyribonucleotide nucleotidyltransferase [Candidatus Neomarinimicrobiota bacterium]
MKRQEMMLNGNTLSIETGQVARQSSGSVIVSHGETTILVAVNAAKEAREDINFFPLQVEYRERHYAGGKIPGGFFKREARPSEHEILTSRLTDRPIRPLFPKSFKCETQVIITVLSSDGENMADTLAGIGASAALMISDIPFNGPIATVRVGRINGDFVVNPTRTQMEDSDMEIIVSGNDETIVMVEGSAKLITEEEFIDAMKFSHGPIKELIALQNALISEIDVVKREIPEVKTDKELEKAVSDLVTAKIDAAIKTGDKHSRENMISALKEEAQEAFVESHPESEKMISGFIGDQLKTAFREQILSDAVRSDGRKTTDIRPITIETGILPRTHGSALFTRGETQAIVVLTMGTPRYEQIIDSMDLDIKKKFFLHYNFPPYCVGETGRVGFTSRREIGHGNLAERAIKEILPEYEDFPYTIRIVSEITESNGSSSMASVCGGSLALMNAGAPSKGHVAGIAMGLIKDGDRYAVLSDILGAEDHLGDMDFKVAGTRDGISAIQLDLKIEGITFDLMEEALAQAKAGRNHILDLMYEAVPEPQEMSTYAPKILSLQINPEKIGGLIGPGGKTIKRIIADTECDVNVDDDGIVTVASLDLKRCQEAIEIVRAITLEPEAGMEFDGTITRLMSFGAFVEFAPGREGLIHISEMEWHRVEKVEDVVKPGDPVRVKLIKVDDQGRLDFSRKALLEKPEGYVERPPRERSDSNRGGGGRRPFRRN